MNIFWIRDFRVILSACLVICILVENVAASERNDYHLFGDFIRGSHKEVKDCDQNSSNLFVFTKSQHFDLNHYEIKILEYKGDTVLMGIHTAYDGLYKNRKGRADTTVVETDLRSTLKRIHLQFQNYRQDRDSVLVMTLDGPQYHFSYCEPIQKVNYDARSYLIDFGLIIGSAQSAKAFSDSMYLILNDFNDRIPFLEYMKPRSVKPARGSGDGLSLEPKF